MYVGVVELLRNLPLYGGRFDSPLIRDLESRRNVLTGQSTAWALVYATSHRSLRLLSGEYGQIESKIFMPFGAETMENDPCTVETTRNYNAGTGTRHRQTTSAQVKERNRQAFQRRIAQPVAFQSATSRTPRRLSNHRAQRTTKASRKYLWPVTNPNEAPRPVVCP